MLLGTEVTLIFVFFLQMQTGARARQQDIRQLLPVGFNSADLRVNFWDDQWLSFVATDGVWPCTCVGPCGIAAKWGCQTLICPTESGVPYDKHIQIMIMTDCLVLLLLWYTVISGVAQETWSHKSDCGVLSLWPEFFFDPKAWRVVKKGNSDESEKTSWFFSLWPTKVLKGSSVPICPGPTMYCFLNVFISQCSRTKQQT